MAWEKINEMFPDGGTYSDNGWITNEYIKANNLKQVELTLLKPVREMIQQKEKIIWYNDGRMDRFYTYDVFPYHNIDNIPLFNIYGQKIYNDLKQEEN